MRVHVTGASGFLGGHVVPLLVSHGHDVTALCRSAKAAATVEALGAQPLAGDLDDPASVDDAFSASHADGLVNLASLGFGHAPAIVAAAEESGMTRAVFISTTGIFTHLDTRSKATRRAAEETVMSSALGWTILRPTMIYGAPGDRNMARLLRLVSRSPVVPLPGGGQRLQQPVHVEDLATAVVSALEADTAVGKIYDVAGPEPLTLRQVVASAAEAVGRSPKLVTVPLGPAIAAAKAYEKVAGRPRIRAEQLERLAEDKAFDISAARGDLGYDPRPFAEGIAQEAKMLS